MKYLRENAAYCILVIAISKNFTILYLLCLVFAATFWEVIRICLFLHSYKLSEHRKLKLWKLKRSLSRDLQKDLSLQRLIVYIWRGIKPRIINNQKTNSPFLSLSRTPVSCGRVVVHLGDLESKLSSLRPTSVCFLLCDPGPAVITGQQWGGSHRRSHRRAHASEAWFTQG